MRNRSRILLAVAVSLLTPEAGVQFAATPTVNAVEN
jgi:hypothetical protein